MYERLAHGHATAYINDLQDYRQLATWIAGPRLKKATEVFEQSSFSKKPGRVLKRLTALLRPRFRPAKICQWTRHSKVVSAKGLASTAENQVFCLTEDTRPLYSERAVFLTELLLSQDRDSIRACVMTCASISHHAIARLVERGGIEPAQLPGGIFFVLNYCAAFAEQTSNTEIDHRDMPSFMLPYEGGALVAVFMNMDPAQMHTGQDRRRILSVRTWLDEDKLSDLDMERMAGLGDEFGDTMLDQESRMARFQRWIEGNARPWRFADSTLGDQVGLDKHDKCPGPSLTRTTTDRVLDGD